MCSGIRWTIWQGFYEYYEGTEHFQQQPHLLLSTPFHPETVHLCGLFVTVVPIELCNVCVCFILVSLLLWEISIACLSVIDSIFFGMNKHSSVQFSHSVVSDSLPPMDCSTPGLPVHHQFSEFTQTHVHRVSDAIQPSHPLLSPSPPPFNLS